MMIIKNLIGEYIFRLSKENSNESWAGGLAWLRYRLDMAGVVGSNPTRPTINLVLFMDSLYISEPYTASYQIVKCVKQKS